MQSHITFNAQTGVVTINGTNSNDQATVSKLSANNQVRVSLVGRESRVFDQIDVLRIDFFGRGGADEFRNSADKSSRVFGGAGNDRLFGSTVADEIHGGTGDDVIRGNGGNDILYGSENNDLINGGSGNDQIYGFTGNDILIGDAGADAIFGGTGNDELVGESGADRLVGNDGHDLLNGGGGNDRITGGSGNDTGLGGDGNDSLFLGNGNDVGDGNRGNDLIFGGDGSDQLTGGGGADRIRGENNDDVITGDSGDDELYGGRGKDSISGGTGNDEIFGEDGDDLLHGDAGADTIDGGGRDDRIFGGSGNDILFGDWGSDQLYGESGADVLNGGRGDDGLFGGVGFRDTLRGEQGDDRLLVTGQDVTLDKSNRDARLVFVNRSSQWTDAEIAVVDEGFRRLHERTSNTRLLVDRLIEDDLTFYKVNSLGEFAAQNVLRSRTRTQTRNGRTTVTTTYQREILIADWDVNNEFRNNQQPELVIHEIAHNWDSDVEIRANAPSRPSAWTSFRNNGRWSETRLNSDYIRSSDRQWWYHRNEEFARDYGRTNPFEDFASVWELYFSIDNISDEPSSSIRSKLTQVDRLFNAIQG